VTAPIADQNRVQPPRPGASVTFVVQHRVRADAFALYEEWLKRIAVVASAYPGYQGVDIIRPVAGDNEEIAGILEKEDRARIHTGIDFWFTPATLRAPRARPWKQWVVTTSAIWPLTFIVPAVIEPLFRAIPWLGLPGLREAIVSAIVVALVVFLIMPRYVRAISPWLYAQPRDSQENR